MEIMPGIHKHHVDLGGRDLFVYSVHGDQHLLIDSGLVGTPESVIEKNLRQSGLSLAGLDMIINTHADADHIGGNERVRNYAPQAAVLCHREDVEMVQNPDALMIDRYEQFKSGHGLYYAAEVNQALRGMMSPALPAVSVGLRGGESICVNRNENVEVLHTPGHSWGHISVYYPAKHLAFVGDSVLGDGVRTHSGDLAAPPTYLDQDYYLNTIQQLESLALRQMMTCHFDVLEGNEVSRFLHDSRRFVDQFELLLQGILQKSGACTMEELIGEISGQWSHYAFAPDFAYAITAHMSKKVRQGIYAIEQNSGRVVWKKN